MGLDPDGRIICRFGSRDHTASDSHNTPAGLLHTMREVLTVHKEESAKPKAAYTMPQKQPNDIAAYARLGVSELVFDFRSESLAESLERMERFGPVIRDTVGV